MKKIYILFLLISFPSFMPAMEKKKTFLQAMPLDLQNEIAHYYKPFRQTKDSLSILARHGIQEKQGYFERENIATAPAGFIFGRIDYPNNKIVALNITSYPAIIKVIYDKKIITCNHANSIDVRVNALKNNMLATYCPHVGIYIWNLANDIPPKIISVTDMHNMRFNDDAMLLITTHWNNESIIWDVASGKQIKSFEHVHGSLADFALLNKQNDKILMMGYQRIAVKDVKNNYEYFKQALPGQIGALWNNEGNHILIYSPHCIQIWDVIKNENIAELIFNTVPIKSVIFLPSDDKIIINHENGLSIWDIHQKIELAFYQCYKQINQILPIFDGRALLIRHEKEIKKIELVHKQLYKDLSYVSLCHAFDLIQFYEDYCHFFLKKTFIPRLLLNSFRRDLENKAKELIPLLHSCLQWQSK